MNAGSYLEVRGSSEVEDAQFLLLAASSQNLRLRLIGESDRADDVVMSKRVKRLSGMGVPDLAIRY